MEITQCSGMISLTRVDAEVLDKLFLLFRSPCDPGTYPRPALLDPQYPRTWILYPSANTLAKGSKEKNPGYKSILLARTDPNDYRNVLVFFGLVNLVKCSYICQNCPQYM